MHSHDQQLHVFVSAMRLEASRVLSLELAPLPGAVLPAAEPGAHVDLHLPGGMLRSYSLLPCAEGRYAVAVLLQPQGRGGSRHIHERLRVGESLTLSAPRNHFRLDESAAHSVLVAGGIGITPLLGMYRRLRKLGRSVQLLYCARSADAMAFREALPEQSGHIDWHLDDVHGGPPDLRAYLAACPADAEYYCCGPTPMIDAFERHAEALGRRAHVERFAAAIPALTASADSAFEVELARSGRRFDVPVGQSILQVLLAAGLDVDRSCEEGACGACETTVIAGEPEHRDCVLSKTERETGSTMMICVSRCRGPRLVLDL